MPTAEIITIGTELLLGEIIDTNSHYIARTLRDAGVDLYRTQTIGDNAERIAQVIQEALKRAEIIITTGGLGPTVDDPTREAVSLAMELPSEFRPELWEQILERFARYNHTPTENNRRQAYVPKNALALENQVGTAPAFIVETERNAVISLPGVPREMEYLMQNEVLPYLRQRYDFSDVILARVLHTAGIGESQIDERIDDLERLSNPTVGLAAHPGQVDVRITAKAKSQEQAAALISDVEVQLRQRLGVYIFGVDNDTLEEVLFGSLKKRGWSLAAVEAGLGGRLLQRLGDFAQFAGGEVLTNRPTPEELSQLARNALQTHQSDCALGLTLHSEGHRHVMHMVMHTPQGSVQKTRSYGGPPKLAPMWAVNLALSTLHRDAVFEEMD